MYKSPSDNMKWSICIKGRVVVNNVHILREEICIMKINRKKAFGMLAVVWVLGIGALVLGNEGKDDADIVEAFAAGNYMDTVGRVSAYVNYGSEYLSHSARQDMAEGIARALGIDSEITLDMERSQSEEGCRVTSSYSLTTPVAQTDISIIAIEQESTSTIMALEQYILVDVSIENSVESAVYYRECIENYFDSIGIDADITLSLKGSVKGPLSNEEKNHICEDILEALGGQLITGSRSNELYTVYGYSEGINEYVVNGTTKSNINVAITYDSVKDASWVYVATPILKEDF